MSDRQTQIVQAARAIVAERGVGALSVRSTAARAGIGASTLRHYFPTQQALFDAVVGAAFHDELDDLRIADTRVPAGQRLTECMAQFLPPSENDIPGLLNWLTMYTAALGPERTEQGTRALTSLTALGRQRVHGWLEVLHADDLLRHADLPRHTTVLMTYLDGLCLALLAPGPGGITVEQARGHLRELIDAMVVAPS